MLFPKGFDSRLAIGLGELVVQAYAQHEANQDGKSWKPEGDYEFVSAIECAPKRGALPGWLRNGPKEGPVPMGFIARRRKDLYVVFRGTVTSGEWAKNLSFNLSEYLLPGRGSAHSGFLELYGSLRDALIASLKKEAPGSRLYVAGHSLGGALATLAAMDIEENAHRKIRAVYTFASPRAGDDAFVQAFNDALAGRSFRIVNTSDIVPSIPLPVPIGMGGYFSHVETPVDFTVQYESVEKNHRMETYLERLRKARKGRGVLGFLNLR